MNEGPQALVPDWSETPSLQRFSISHDEWRDGLLIRSSNWLGDAVMAVPAMKQLKALLPENCGLFVACPKGLAPLFKSLRIVDWTLPLADAHAFMRLSELGSVKRLQPGACLMFNNSLRDVLSLRLALVPKIFGASARMRDLLLTRSWSFPKRVDRVLNKPHQASKYLAMAYALGAPAWDGRFPEMNPQREPETASRKVLDALNASGALAVAAGAAYGDAKRWPAESFREVCRWWIESNGGPVFILGSKGEKPIADEVAKGLPEDRTFNFAGETKLEELIDLLKASKACLANDSGVMHLAAALGVKGVAIFGSTDPAATSPLSKDWRLLFDKLDCAPCFKRDCPKGTKECLSRISPELAIKSLRELL